jgi:DNA primase
VSLFDLLRDGVDLVELAGRNTDLRFSGRAYVGRCPHPDHEDRSPSFHVYPDRRFHCYGCGWRGDVTDLWAGVNGLGPGIEAALDLARGFGVELPDADPATRKKAEERRQREAELLGEAEVAHAALAQDPDVAEWWERRGFDESLRRRFLLGAHGGAATIPFWNRGRVEGLITRRLRGEPKYELQKAEDLVRGYKPLFVPGPVRGEVFLVEGYVDALALAALGYSAVAVGGTHVSGRQLDELRLIPGPIYVLPDNDDSGDKAARSWVEELYPNAMLCRPNYEKENDDRD